MRAKVTEKGVMIPRELLEGIAEVEITSEDDRIVIVPAVKSDPILGLGKSPVECGAPDASVSHDRYLHESAS
ncbi:MAG: hypothetical protein AAGE59_21440 [Cyanobacteria bacterium P01_F01_bin.86]